MSKTQLIKKSDLKVIYDQICENWQKKLQEILLWSEGKEIEISEELIQQGYKEANNNQKKLIEKYFKIETSKDICQQITNISSVYRILGIKRNLPYKIAKTKEEKCLNATYDLMNIAKVYNGNWTPDWKNSNQYKWTIYFSGVGSGLVCFYCYSYCCYPSGAHFSKKEYAEDSKIKFKDIWLDFFMI